MDILLLVIGIMTLLFSLKKIAMIKYSKKYSVLKEAKQNVILLLWGVLILSAMIFIPYQVWVLTGSSHYWDGAYIIGGTAFFTIISSFIFYYKCNVKFN